MDIMFKVSSIDLSKQAKRADPISADVSLALSINTDRNCIGQHT